MEVYWSLYSERVVCDSGLDLHAKVEAIRCLLAEVCGVDKELTGSYQGSCCQSLLGTVVYPAVDGLEIKVLRG